MNFASGIYNQGQNLFKYNKDMTTYNGVTTRRSPGWENGRLHVRTTTEQKNVTVSFVY